MDTDYAKLLSAALTPILGILMAYIGYQQWHTNDRKVRLDFYERRLAIYLAAMEFLACIVHRATIRDEELSAFLQKTREGYFLFGRDIADYLDTLYRKAVDLQAGATMLHDPMGSLPVGEERSRVARANAELSEWFGDQFVVTRNKFAKYMTFS
ncbi:MAG TPA: hypothetical protein VG167_04025 [Verrucomicrobiae bacterium]|nr:hypothetical protein [Verrucomicrobiae bacterium]